MRELRPLLFLLLLALCALLGGASGRTDRPPTAAIPVAAAIPVRAAVPTATRLDCQPAQGVIGIPASSLGTSYELLAAPQDGCTGVPISNALIVWIGDGAGLQNAVTVTLVSLLPVNGGPAALFDGPASCTNTSGCAWTPVLLQPDTAYRATVTAAAAGAAAETASWQFTTESAAQVAADFDAQIGGYLHPQGDPTPAGLSSTLLTQLNAQYRVPLGLAPLVWSQLAAKAAQNHVVYWKRNGITAGLGAHEESAGKPGFTGVEPWDRCIAAGLTVGCGEVAYPGVPIGQAVFGWLQTPFHGEGLLGAAAVGFGSLARVGSVADLTGSSLGPLQPQTVAGPASWQLNTPGSAVKIWPFNGDKQVPLSWSGGEIPDPLAAYTGSQSVGPVFHIYSPLPLMLRLYGPKGGQLPLIGITGQKTATLGVLLNQSPDGDTNWRAAFAKSPLKPRTYYRLTLSLPGSTASWSVGFSSDAE